MEKVSGFLEVGPNDDGEVVINHPDLKPDENGVGHIVFSPNQARNLAMLLFKHADAIDRQSGDTPAGPLTLVEWLIERKENCKRIAARTTGSNRDGWLEDERYFTEAI